MGDEDLEDTSDESVESEDSSINENESNLLSESVDKVKKKTLTSINKWNNEKFLFALDRQLISSGIRLLLFLPAFAILAFFGAWSQATTSPDWWEDFVEPTIGYSFASILVILVFVILLGYILSMAVHRHRVNLSINNFRNISTVVNYKFNFVFSCN